RPGGRGPRPRHPPGGAERDLPALRAGRRRGVGARPRPGARARLGDRGVARRTRGGRGEPGRRLGLPRRPAGRGGVMPRALVVDDDLAIREMVALALAKSGFTVARASRVTEARREIAAARPDLVVSDIYMPGEDGLSFLSEVRALEDAPPIILMT